MKENQPESKSFLLGIPLLGRYFFYYGIFRRYAGDRALILGGISVFSTLTEGAGIAAFIAYIQFLAANGTQSSPIISKLIEIFQWLGIEFVPTRVIPVLVLVFAVRSLLVFIGKGYHFRLYSKILGGINEDLAQAVASMRYSEYLKHNSGFFTHLVTTEVYRSVTAFYQISAMVPMVISISLYILLSIRVDWRFTVLAGMFGVITALIARMVMKGTSAASRELSQSESSMSSLVVQLLQSFKYLFSTGSLGPLQKKISKSAGRVAAAGSRIGFLSAILPASSETVIVAFLGSMVYLQTQVFGRTVEAMMVAMLFLYRAMRETTTLQGSWQGFNSYVGGVDVLIKTLKDLRGTAEPKGGKAFQGIGTGIDLKNVTFAYGEAKVLKNVNLHIPANSMVAFVGESGAGKSTLVDMLTSLMLPSEGDVLVDGTSYRDLDRNSLRARIGYVTQESVVFDDTVANNVSLWRWDQSVDGLENVRVALKRANCLSFVEKFAGGLQEIVGERGIRLSGGQRQRLSIARELYKSPALMILDEATSALDSESERAVQDSIDALKGTTTIVMIAHRLATVRNCDLIFVLKEGSLVETGSFSELYKSGKYFRAMCDAQSLQ
ncbi:MAG: ABC transporter ATP-binding protein [Bacteriovoracia bacterium]